MHEQKEFENFKQVIATGLASEDVIALAATMPNTEEIQELSALIDQGCDLESLMFGLLLTQQVIAEVSAANRIQHVIQMANFTPLTAEQVIQKVSGAVKNLMDMLMLAHHRNLQHVTAIDAGEIIDAEYDEEETK